MKNTKILMMTGAILTSLTLVGGCGSTSGDLGSSRNDDVNSLSGELVEKLPEDQKDVELDKLLAQLRKQRKEGYSTKDGMDIMMSPNGLGVLTQPENMPEYEDLGEEFYVLIFDYLENELKIPKRPGYEYDIDSCLDPRINALYDDADKGVMAGYENENIRIEEYETEKDDVYSYLFLARDSKGSIWKVIHHGNSYKE